MIIQLVRGRIPAKCTLCRRKGQGVGEHLFTHKLWSMILVLFGVTWDLLHLKDLLSSCMECLKGK